ncbi:MAG: DNRLRE domain-containing protein, partial [Ilumatobacteraceae bacterium]
AGRKRAQVFSPPYLELGPRPTITSAPSVAAWSSTISVATPDAGNISKVALLRAAGSTHTFDHNQRYVPLEFTAQSGSLTVRTPVDGWTAPPGDYMLVIENSAGVPSAATWLRIGSAGDLLPGEVTGVVTSATSGLPVDGATVTHGATSVATNSDGRFTMSDLPPGERPLTVSAPGFANQTRTASVVAAGVTTLDFALLAPSTVAGRVTDTVGSPVVGALVEVAGRSVTTGSNGEYSVEIESGAHQVRVSAITHLAATTPISAPPNESVVLDVVLADAPTILEGEVLDASTDQPILGATVTFAGGTTTTDDNGFYKFVDVEPDTYTVTASAPGYLPLTEPVLVDKGFAATLDFGLSPIPPPTTTHHPVADARIKSTSASSNYGSDTSLRTRYDVPGSTIYRSYLRFDVGQLAGPVVSARLRLFASDGSDDGGSVYPVGWTGSETAINWSNAPALAGSPIAHFGVVGNNAWAEVDVTSAVGSGGVISFALDSRSTNSAFYSSREGANPPELIIETSGTTTTQITSILPARGAVGDQVTLLGRRMGNVTGVSFGGVSAAIASRSDDRVETTVPLGATTGPITVDGPDGAATSDVFTVLVAPEISGFEPASGPPSTQVTITGTGFATTRAVSFRSTPTTFSIVSDTEISATVPSGATDGVIKVTNQVASTSSSSSFVVTNPPPVDSFQPTGGIVGTVVTIRGSGFSTVSDVSFGGLSATFAMVSDFELTANVPTGASSGPITVTNATGATTTDPFTVIVPPTITDFNPRNGVAGDTQIDVTITGTGLSTVTEVRFNGTPAIGLSIDSDTQIRVEVPVGASTGPISVTNPAGTTDTGTDHYVVSSPPPNLTFTPTDDAPVRKLSSKNYGSLNYLRTRAGEWETYIRFDVSGLPNRPASAKLRLWVTDRTSGGVDVYSTATGWTESSITGTSSPAPSGPSIANTGPISAGAWLEIDVSAGVTTAGPVGFLLRGRNTDSLYMDAKEGLNPPQLVVETAPVVGPLITSFSPGSGPVGTPVDIFGSNLTTVTELRFGAGVIPGHQLTGGAIINGTHIRVPVPAGATTGPIVAVGRDGTFTTATNFVVTTPPPPDTTAPTVVANTPADAEVGVAPSTDVTATFSERVIGVDAQSFKLSDGVGNVPTVVTYDDSAHTARLHPVVALAPDRSYTVSLTSAITDRAGAPNALTAVSWAFTTASQSSTSTTTFRVVADAMIKSSSPTRNYGSDTTLRNRSGSPEWRTLLAFDVQGLSGTVTKATVRLFVTDPSTAAGSISAISTAWTESSVTWSNAPAVGGVPNDTIGAVSNGTWAEWDVTAAINRNGSFAFALVSASTDSVIFDSRENPSGNVPQLVITTGG